MALLDFIYSLVRRLAAAVVLAAAAPALASAERLPIFDVHLHYDADAREVFSPEEVVALLDRNGITRALVSSTPNDGTRALYRHAPKRIVPFLAPYRTRADRRIWFEDEALLAQMEEWLEEGIWRGIGEFHLFSGQTDTPVIRRLLELAVQQGLILQAHGDALMITQLYATAPEVVIIWAHAGTEPRPPVLAWLLERYPTLHVDLSVRNPLVAPDGRLDPEWRALFLRFPDRFLAGVDTFSVNRWRNFDAVVERTRLWLSQLPPEVARQIAHGNAERLFD